MLDIDGLKFAIEDARVRHSSLLDMTKFVDGQAMSLLRLYVTLLVAALAGSFAVYAPNDWSRKAALLGLTVASCCFFAGAMYCFSAMRSAAVQLPGRGPEFWLHWADKQSGIELNDVLREHLRQHDENIKLLRELNTQSASALDIAKKLGLVATPAALAAAALVYYLRVVPPTLAT